MLDSKYKSRANKVVNDLRHKWNDLQKNIRFCLDHKFEFEAQILQKQAAVLHDVIIQLEIEFEIK